MDKYHQALNQFEAPLSNEAISQKIEKILEKEYQKNYTKEVLRCIHGAIDLTSLTGMDTRESILKMVHEVNDFNLPNKECPNVAAICTYPNFVATVKENLTAEGVEIAAVSGGFPASQTFVEVKVAETSLAVMDGADEIDVVISLGYLQEDDLEALTNELEELREVTKNIKLKVILETGALKDPKLIQKAAILALYCGADFIKTSTGKEYPGATLNAAYIMAETLKKYYELHGTRKGIKISGGVRTAEDAVKYYTIIKHVLGEEWMKPETFRIGASSLVKAIREEL